MRRRPRNIVKPEKAWAIVDNATDKLVVLSGQPPLYWHRSVARDAATQNGFSSYGRTADVSIRRVLISMIGPVSE